MGIINDALSETFKKKPTGNEDKIKKMEEELKKLKEQKEIPTIKIPEPPKIEETKVQVQLVTENQLILSYLEEILSILKK